MKLVVVACNTASAYALPTLQRELEVPVIGVIEPGAARRSGKPRMAASVSSAPWGRSPARLSGDYSIVGARGAGVLQSVPHFCAACRGRLDHRRRAPGCCPRVFGRISTFGHRHPGAGVHPLSAFGGGNWRNPCEAVTLVDSAEETARTVAEVLGKEGLAAEVKATASYRFLVSDAPGSFQQIGRRFLDWAPAAVSGWISNAGNRRRNSGSTECGQYRRRFPCPAKVLDLLLFWRMHSGRRGDRCRGADHTISSGPPFQLRAQSTYLAKEAEKTFAAQLRGRR